MKKLDDRSRVLIHLGTESGSKAYRLLDPQTKKVVVSRDVVFDETKGWNWTQDDSTQDGEGSFKVMIEDFGDHELKEKEGDADTDQISPEQNDDSNSETSQEAIEEATESSESVSPLQALRRSTRQVSRPKYLEDYVLLAEEEGEMLLLTLNNEPRCFYEAREHKEWIRACEEEINSIERLETWNLVNLPV